MKKILFLLVTILFISCTKNNFGYEDIGQKNTYVTIHVVDFKTNSVVTSGNVRLYVKGKTGAYDQTKSLNSSGDALFDVSQMFKSGQHGIAILDVLIDGNPSTPNVIGSTTLGNEINPEIDNYITIKKI